jgi:hypothetical protein
LDDGIIASCPDQRTGRAAHAGNVPVADRRHQDDLAVDKLDAVALGQNTGLRHTVVLVGREALFDDGCAHRGFSILPARASGVPSRITQ